MTITFQQADIKFTLSNRIALCRFVQQQILKSSSRKTFTIYFVFCSDEYLLDINKKFLNHDYYTDIITFPLVQTEVELEAEIYISIDRVKENSLRFSVLGSQLNPKLQIRNPQFVQELHRVLFHGVLHLLGYKDKTKVQKTEMRRMEDAWLKQFDKFNSKSTKKRG